MAKLVERLAMLSPDPVTYDGRQVGRPMHTTREPWGWEDGSRVGQVLLDPSLSRSFRCVDGCEACCLPFTLDFTPDEWTFLEWDAHVRDEAEERFSTRFVDVNGVGRLVVSYRQDLDPSCPFLKPMGATMPLGSRSTQSLGCSFWDGGAPLECATAPNLHMDGAGPDMRWTVLTRRPYRTGASWDPPASCCFGEVGEVRSTSWLRTLLLRYMAWATHLGLLDAASVLRQVIDALPLEWSGSVLEAGGPEAFAPSVIPVVVSSRSSRGT